MSRVKRGTVTKRRHKKILSYTKGFWGQRSNVFRRAKETLLRSWAKAFVGRKLKKRNMRALFITRIRAAARKEGISYSVLMYKLKINKIELNRKMLSQLAIFDPAAFSKIVSIVQK